MIDILNSLNSLNPELVDAPEDGKQYARKDGAWVEVVSASGGVIDLTLATEDYPLSVGETATMTYTNATSVPLHVKTVEGLYEIDLILAGVGSTNYTNNILYLLPNNALVTAGNINWERIRQTSSTIDGWGDNLQQTAFVVGHDSAGVRSSLEVSTFTRAKVVSGTLLLKSDVDTTQQFLHYQPWMDTSTLWVSMGTINSPLPISGKIVIRRIA
jgi:hypothetical protein